MEGVMEENQCGRCHKKTWVLISCFSLYDTDICKTCYLKLKVHKDTLSGKSRKFSSKQGVTRSKGMGRSRGIKGEDDLLPKN